jgi:hypothetical protein
VIRRAAHQLRIARLTTASLIGRPQPARTRNFYEVHFSKGDRVALLGLGIAVVEQADEREALVIFGNRLFLRIRRKHIVLSQRNLRWECRIRS